MRTLTTGLALLLALVVQSALSLVLPGQGRLLDPFLLVVVYCGLVGGETHGMLAGAAAGWIQDIEFGGGVSGLSALTKLVLGFVVGMSATRFLIASAAARGLVLFAATLLDALCFERLALIFEVPASDVSVAALLARATLNALVGGAVFHLLETRFKREARA